MTRYLGIDIGGTNMRVAVSGPDGAIARRAQAPTPLELATGLDLLWRLIDQAGEGEPFAAIGVSIGGPLEWRSGVVSPLHQPNWRAVPLRATLEDRFGCPVRLDVDTNIAAAGEYRADPMRPARLLYLTLSTGMGGGFVIDGRIYRGVDDAHPEIAHQAIPFRCPNPERVVCECGAVGCLEALISGNGIRRIYGRAAEALDPIDWDDIAFNLGQGLRNLAAIYTPGVVILAGSVALGGGPRLIAAATDVMRSHLRLVPVPEVRLSALGQDSALIGALTVARFGYDGV